MTRAGTEQKALSGLRVLVVDDEADIRQGLRRLIASLGATVSMAADGQEALQHLSRESADLVLSDLMMPRMSGSELLLEIKRRSPATVVVVITGFGTIQSAVASLQNGAAHFMTKPFDNQEVLRLVERLGRQVLAQRSAPPGIRPSQGTLIIAEDPAMVRVMELVARVAPSPVAVLIEGESGTGKELVARAIHEQSAVRDRAFLAVNAAALPDTLLESELFGYKRGAFTGADRDRDGIFVEARGGTVFLDEISSMSTQFQGKLLRVLQEKRLRPLGASGDMSVDFRLVSATNRDLGELIEKREFRDDLFYRLGVVRIRLPRLKERPKDIAPLARHLLQKAATLCLPHDARVPELSDDAMHVLESYDWPGNVRELENALQRAVVVAAESRILPHHLGLGSERWTAPRTGNAIEYESSKQLAIERFQREFIERALESSGGNISHAAERCGLTRAAFQRIMRQLGIERAAFS
jgi:DNA-binding NtrC family response regulator